MKWVIAMMAVQGFIAIRLFTTPEAMTDRALGWNFLLLNRQTLFGSLLLGALTWLAMVKPRLAGHWQAWIASAAQPRGPMPLLVQLGTCLACYALAWPLYFRTSGVGVWGWPLLLAWCVAVIACAGASLWLLAPGRYWRALLASERSAVTVAGIGVIGSGALIALVYRAWTAVPQLASFTLNSSAWLLRPYYPQMKVDPATAIIEIDHFSVQISDACSGYFGVSLTLGFLACYCYVFRAEIRPWLMAALLPVGVVMSLSLNAVRHVYGARATVDGLNLTLSTGSICCLLGPSGCGKTTTLRMAAGLETATSGRILIGGRDVTHAHPMARDIALVFQNYALMPHLDAVGNVALSLLHLPAAQRRTQAQRWLAEFFPAPGDAACMAWLVTAGHDDHAADHHPAAAHVRRAAAGTTNVRFQCADAQTETAEGGPFDRLVSRFGVMFFGDAATLARFLGVALIVGGVAIIAIERQIGLRNYIEGGIPIDAVLTYDLIVSILAAYDARVERVIINDFNDNIFFARLILVADNELHQRKIMEIDARPSDCLALALRALALAALHCGSRAARAAPGGRRRLSSCDRGSRS